MKKKYEKNHDVYGMLSGAMFLQICKSQCVGNDQCRILSHGDD